MTTRSFLLDRTALAVVMLLSVAALPAEAQRHGMTGMGPMHGMGSHGGGMPHDSTARAHMAVIHDLIMNHGRITRSVTRLPNGIRTVTESEDTLLARRIREHVVAMNARVTSGVDPAWPMESEALRALYRNSALIHTRVDSTARGIIVEQTSTDSATVSALQTHAAEVTALVERGHEAMHAAMMQHRGSVMMHGPHGPHGPHWPHGHADSTARMRPRVP